MEGATIIQPGVETQSLHSDILNQEYQLHIKLPWSYDSSDTVFPVLFCLDANRAFPLYSTMSLIYETPGTKAEEIIVVGIGYKIDSDRMRGLAEWGIWRTRDLTPVRREETEQYWRDRLSPLLGGEKLVVQTGGAPTFLKSFREELIPYIEANYRVSTKDRGLAGYSYGGLFTLYALFHAADVFKRYFAGSPTIWDQIFEYEEQYASDHDDLKAELCITAGSLEAEVQERVQRMVDRLRSRGYPQLNLHSHTLENEGHASAYAASVSRALRVLYYHSHP
jgi:hypothetical protein